MATTIHSSPDGRVVALIGPTTWESVIPLFQKGAWIVLWHEVSETIDGEPYEAWHVQRDSRYAKPNLRDLVKMMKRYEIGCPEWFAVNQEGSHAFLRREQPGISLGGAANDLYLAWQYLASEILRVKASDPRAAAAPWLKPGQTFKRPSLLERLYADD